MNERLKLGLWVSLCVFASCLALGLNAVFFKAFYDTYQTSKQNAVAIQQIITFLNQATKQPTGAPTATPEAPKK